MAAFRFYHVSTFDGCVYGIPSKEVAEEIAGSEDDFVIDTETNEWIQADGKRVQITERV